MTRDFVKLECVLFSLATAAIAEAILMQTSAEQVPSLHRAAPSYLKLITASNFWPFMFSNICTDVVHAVGHDLSVSCADYPFHMPLLCLEVHHCCRPNVALKNSNS